MGSLFVPGITRWCSGVPGALWPVHHHLSACAGKLSVLWSSALCSTPLGVARVGGHLRCSAASRGQLKVFTVAVVRIEGFEPPISCSQSRRVAKLRYIRMMWCGPALLRVGRGHSTFVAPHVRFPVSGCHPWWGVGSVLVSAGGGLFGPVPAALGGRRSVWVVQVGSCPCSSRGRWPCAGCAVCGWFRVGARNLTGQRLLFGVAVGVGVGGWWCSRATSP